MSIRRDTNNRRTLYRTCYTCGKEFSTTASSPFMRQMYNVDGKKQKTCYFCSDSCKRASYKYISWYDGKAEERRRAREAARDVREKNRRYYQAHVEQERQRSRERYWADPQKAQADMAYQRRKRGLVEIGGTANA